VQGRFSFTSAEIELLDEPSGYTVHALLDGEFSSHVQAVA
jgi:hypothetical protein